MRQQTKFSIREALEAYGAENLPHRPGGWAKIKCVIHEDSNPSASFNESKGQFRCFTCDFFGDALDLIQLKEGVDYAGSVKR